MKPKIKQFFKALSKIFLMLAGEFFVLLAAVLVASWFGVYTGNDLSFGAVVLILLLGAIIARGAATEIK